MQTLSKLKTGQTATIMALHVDSAFRYRLNALGFKIGKPLSVLRSAPFSGPLHLRLGNTEVMLRKDDAAQIEVEL